MLFLPSASTLVTQTLTPTQQKDHNPPCTHSSPLFSHHLSNTTIIDIYLKIPNQTKSQRASVDRYPHYTTNPTSSPQNQLQPEPNKPTYTPKNPSETMTSLTASSIQWGVVPHVALERVRCRALFCLRSRLRMVVASVARLFEEVICSGCLCASDLGFEPVFPPEYSTSVACGR